MPRFRIDHLGQLSAANGAMVAVYGTRIPDCCIQTTPRGGQVLKPCCDYHWHVIYGNAAPAVRAAREAARA